jgi:8-oxo-dGTP diphosphatase
MNVVGLITRDGEFLMVYNPVKDGWELPGGKVEEGETPEEALRRECMEEAGAEIGALTPLGRLDGETLVFQAPLIHMGRGEMRAALFAEPPEDTAYPREELEEIISLWRGCRV